RQAPGLARSRTHGACRPRASETRPPAQPRTERSESRARARPRPWPFHLSPARGPHPWVGQSPTTLEIDATGELTTRVCRFCADFLRPQAVVRRRSGGAALCDQVLIQRAVAIDRRSDVVR